MKLSLFTVLVSGLAMVACTGGKSTQNPVPPPPVVNQPPVLNAIANQTITANQTSSMVVLSITDEAPESVVVSTSADDKQLVLDSGIQVSGTGANRTLSITPVPDVTGETTINIEVVDSDGLSDMRDVRLTIVAQQQSLDQFIREKISAAENFEPDLINAVDFIEDIDQQDFSDLFNP